MQKPINQIYDMIKQKKLCIHDISETTENRLLRVYDPAG